MVFTRCVFQNIRFALLILTGVFPLCDALSQTTAKPPAPLRIISWNIEWYPGQRRNPTPSDERRHIPIVRQELQNYRPDIFLAQEIRDWQSFADLCRSIPGLQPAVVSAFAGEFAPELGRTGEYWPQQLAIGSRLPVIAAWSERWQNAGTEAETPPRGFAAALIALPGRERHLLVYSVHLKSNRGREDPLIEQQITKMRHESVRQLLSHVDLMENRFFPNRIAAVVVGGDFNTNHDGDFSDKTIQLMVDAGFHNTWQNVPREQRLTWRGREGFSPTTFDYIFTKGITEATAKMLPGNDAASDHNPVLLEVKLSDIPQ